MVTTVCMGMCVPRVLNGPSMRRIVVNLWALGCTKISRLRLPVNTNTDANDASLMAWGMSTV